MEVVLKLNLTCTPVVLTLLVMLTPAQEPHDAMVASQNAIASAVGASFLEEGGNAVDAAVATGFALAVVHPSAGNIGGGGFMVIRLSNGRSTTFDFRECAPLSATPDMFLDENGEYDSKRHHRSHLSVGVPGTVAGLYLAHQRYGSLPWRRLLAPAVALARDGFSVTQGLQRGLESYRKYLEPHAASRRSFFGQGGAPLKVGSLLIQSDLALTLERIQRSGRDGFYLGETARLITREMKRGGGRITEKDLQTYQAKERAPVKGTYRGHEIIGMGPPSSGGITVINMLNMLETFPVERGPADRIHILCEIMRRGFADRARHLGDPDFNPKGQGLHLLAKEHGRKRAATIDIAWASKSVLDGISVLPYESEDTTHYSVVDGFGNAVSLTYTLENAYGSGIVVDGAGFLLNDEMGDFNPRAGLTTAKGLIGTKPNLIAPGKRMLSSMSPTIVVRNGKPLLVVGSPGGRTIINTVFQIITNVIDLRHSMQSAVELGRLHHQWMPDKLRIEERLLTDEIASELRSRGHTLQTTKGMGAAECIQVGTRRGRPRLQAGIDPRAPDAGATSVSTAK